MNMIEKLCRQKDRAVALCRILALIIFLLVIIIASLVVKLERAQERERLYLKLRSEVRIETNLLCKVNNNLNSILRMEISKMKADWEDDVTKACL
jgi:sensor domain CHASE-containing protein